MLAAVAIVLGGCRAETADPGLESELARLGNLGRAHLENRESDPALTAFTAAVERAPDLPAAWRNLARARLLARDGEGALEALATATALEDGSAATRYLTGIANARLGRAAEAAPHFEAAVRLDPDEAALRYQLAAAYQTAGRHEEAEQQFREAVRLDPWHASAYYRLARYAAAAGRREDFERWNREFLHLRELAGGSTRTPEELEVSAYTTAEPLAGQEAVARPAGLGEAIPVRFTDATDQALHLAREDPSVVACLLDTAPGGGYTVAVIGRLPRLLTWGDGRFEVLPLDAPSPPEVDRCVTANYFDPVPPGEPFDPETDALRDMLLLGPDGVRLWQRSGPQSFRDATAESGLVGLKARTVRWVDVDHDGDLDLITAEEDGLELWQNRGDGTFRRDERSPDLPSVASAAHLASADLEGTVAVDLVVARGSEPTVVLRGEREGRFAREPEPPGSRPAARRVLLDDLDNDGRIDFVLLGEDIVTIQPGGTAADRRLDLGGMEASEVVLLDHDNDGLLDLWVAGWDPASGEGRLRAWRNEAANGWSPADASLGLDRLRLEPVLDLMAADFDGDGDTDLLAHTAGGLRFLRNDGGNLHGQLKLRLVGTKTNPDGIGTLVEVAAGRFQATRAVGDLPIEIGVGPRKRLDAVRTVWTNGVVDNHVDVEVGVLPITIVEKNVATGSCPFLYAWDGERFRFVTDLLGNSPVGLPIRRGEVLPADSEELVWVGEARHVVPRDDFYRLLVTSELREVLYLDHVELLAVDHPPDVEVHSTDKIRPPPFPPSELWPLTGRRPLRTALANGADLTAELLEIDGLFAPPGVLLPPPLRGMTYPHSVVLDFGPLEPDRHWVLALTGWLQYGDASTNIAVSQNPGVAFVPPKLEAEAASGRWVEIPVTVGLPAGKTKTIICDLEGALPGGARRLRLTTNFEVRWDRIALFERVPVDALTTHRLALGGADLAFRGFSEISARSPHHPTVPDPERVSPRPQWRTVLAGWSTRYGPVGELLGRRDGRLVIVSAGDALELSFAAGSLPPAPEGQRRSFFFRSVGWDKDGDHNVAGGDLVEPLPGAAAGSWQARYNTRYVPRHLFDPTREEWKKP